jgi:hypothetical protein
MWSEYSDDEKLLTKRQVARLYRVDVRTVEQSIADPAAFSTLPDIFGHLTATRVLAVAWSRSHAYGPLGWRIPKQANQNPKH